MAVSGNPTPPSTEGSRCDSFVSGTRPLKRIGTVDPKQLDSVGGACEADAHSPRPLTAQLDETIKTWSRSHYELVVLAAAFADSPEWIVTGSPTPAHWIAIVADIESCTAREWIRIGRLLQQLPAITDAFERNGISYSKVRTLTRLATPQNEIELLDNALSTTAADLGRALAAWFKRNTAPEDIAKYHQKQRSASALVHDSTGKPIDATNRRRHPSRRQKRLVKERDHECVDCGRDQLLEYDHVPAYEQTGHTITAELELCCAPCHHKRHRSLGDWPTI